VHFTSSDFIVETGWADYGVGGLEIIEKAGRYKVEVVATEGGDKRETVRSS
jgi:hypothetical protein